MALRLFPLTQDHITPGSSEVLHRVWVDEDNDLQALPRLLAWFEETVRSLLPHWQDPTVCWECQLILTEAFTNAVRHAHVALSSPTPIAIEVLQFVDRLELRVWDSGPSFDFAAALAKVVANPPSPSEGESGRGLLLMAQLADAIDYVRVEHHNCLIACKTAVKRVGEGDDHK